MLFLEGEAMKMGKSTKVALFVIASLSNVAAAQVGVAVDNDTSAKVEMLFVQSAKGATLANGKLTLPLIYLRDKLGAADCERFLSYLKDPEPVSRIIDWLKESGAIREGLRQAANFAHQAQGALHSFPESSPKASLNAIADYIVTRTR